MLWHSVDGTNFFEYKTSLDKRSNTDTLLITDKNHNQLKFYYKALLSFLNEIDEVLSEVVYLKNLKAMTFTKKHYKLLKTILIPI